MLQSIQRLESHSADQLNEWEKKLSGTDIDVKTLVKLTVNKKPLQVLVKKQQTEIAALEKNLDVGVKDSLARKLQDSTDKLSDFEERVGKKSQLYKKQLTDMQAWEVQRNSIIGTPDGVGSLSYYEAQLKALDDVPNTLVELYKKRDGKAEEMHKLLREKQRIFQELFQPVQSFIDSHALVKDKYNLGFTVAINEKGFSEGFFSIVSQSASGTFYGDGRKVLREILDRYDFNNAKEAVAFANEIIGCLKKDKRTAEGEQQSVKKQLKKLWHVEDLYNHLYSFSYLKPEYKLQLDNKSLEQLTPGERGVLLLIFYLLIDKDTHPLVIDQPEENLDPESVFRLLVPCIKEAKSRRQIFIITHSPNLAVVCDADQIIHASIDKTEGNKVSYKSGALENPTINHAVVDILEGTPPAFMNRFSKYPDLEESLERYPSS